MSLESVAQGKDAQAAAADALGRLGGAPLDPPRDNCAGGAPSPLTEMLAAFAAAGLTLGQEYTCGTKKKPTRFQEFCRAHEIKLPFTWSTVRSPLRVSAAGHD